MKAPPLSRSSTPSTDRLSAPKPKPGLPTMAPSNPTTPVTPRIRSTPASSTTTTTSSKSLHPNLAARSPNPGARTSRTGTILGPETPTNRPLSVASIRPTSSASIRPTSSAGLRKKDLNPSSGRESPRFFHASDAHGQSPAARVKGLPLASARGEKLPNTARISSGGAAAGAAGPLLAPTAPKHGVANISPPTSRPTSILAPSTPRQSEEMKAQGPLTPGLEPGAGRNQVKFVYANGTEEILAPRNSSSDADSGSGLGMSSLPVSPGVSSGVSTATSPSKLGFPFSPMPSPHAQPTPQQIYQRHMSGGGSRRSSIVNRHNRTVSIGSIGEMFKPAEETGLGIKADDMMLEAPQTPHVVTQEMEDLAATARRDRRVLDLEISNNSLSAINKTLEREMRKQASQLRRYKRLLRTPTAAAIPAPISPPPQTDDEASTADDSDTSDTSATSTASHSTASTTHNRTPAAAAALPQQPTAADSDADSDSDSDSDSSTSGEPQTRLGLDLEKHQALLDASAKMNASLKRCQLVTDALILEGNKALEYKVAPDEVRLGGRVLRTYEESMAGETDDEVGFTEDEGGLGDDDEETENEGSGSEGSREVWLQRHSLF